MLVADQQLILLAWLVVGMLVLGLGLAAQAPLERAADLWGAFWLGFGCLLTLLQLWHLVLPIDDRARIAIAVLGAAGLTVRGFQPWRLALRALPRHVPTLAIILASAWWLSNRSLAGPSLGDTGAYLVPTIHWMEAYPIVPGLANVFVPLGHNFSYLLYAALLDAGPFAHRPWHIINGLLLLPLFARAALAAVRLLRRSGPPIAVELYYVCVLPALVELGCGLLLTSPTPDFAVHIIGFVLAGELLALVTTDRPARRRSLGLVFVAAAGMTMKASLAMLALATIAVATWWWWRRARPDAMALTRTLALVVGLAGLPVAIWMTRNVITSGCPLYPSRFAALPVEWLAGNDAVAWIQRPMEFPIRTFWSDPHWAYERLLNLGWSDPEVQMPTVLMAFAVLLTPLVRALRRWRGRHGDLTPVVVVPALLSFAFVFVNTPMPKYQGAILWVVPIELLLVGLAGALAGARRWARVGVVALALAGTMLPLSRIESPLTDLIGFQPVSKAPFEPRQLPSGLSVYVPAVADSCADAPLPCTPEPHPGLRLRRPDDLSAGFVIDGDLPS